MPFFVIPEKAGIQINHALLEPRLEFIPDLIWGWGDGFEDILRSRQY
jgi:hypothetical protein